MRIVCETCVGRGWIAEMQIDIYSGQTYPVWNGICKHCQGTGLSEEGAHLVATVERLAAIHLEGEHCALLSRSTS